MQNETDYIDEAQYLMDEDELLRPFCDELYQKMMVGGMLAYIKTRYPEHFVKAAETKFEYGVDEAIIAIELNEFVEKEVRLGISFRKAIRNAIAEGFGSRFTELELNEIKKLIK